MYYLHSDFRLLVQSNLHSKKIESFKTKLYAPKTVFIKIRLISTKLLLPFDKQFVLMR